jgi:hypothetical protein
MMAGRFITRAIVCAVLILGPLAGGCGKKSSATPGAAEAKRAAEAPPKAPEGPLAEAVAAIDRKDYDAAIAVWVRGKASAVTDEQKLQFMVLSSEIKGKLIDAAATEPKAAEALANLRAMSAGR